MDFDQLIPGYPKGSDITIMDCIYHFPYLSDNQNNSKYNIYKSDTMTILFKDNITNEKKIHIIKKPKYVFYFREEDPGYSMFFENESNLKEIECNYKDLEKTIAGLLNRSAEYETNIENKNFKANKEFHKDRRIFGSDININDFYRSRFAEQYTNRETHISRAFLDIETDNSFIGGEFPTEGNCPISAISYFEFDSKELYTLLLDIPKNPLIKKFIDEFDEEKINNEYLEFLTNAIGGPERLQKFNLDKLKTHVYMYTKEIDLISDLFKFINMRKPDFILAWNMAFDIPYIIDRIRVLGYNPEDIMCSYDINGKQYCEYVIDEMHKNEFAERGDYADISSYSIYLDQMIQFASRRKGNVFMSYRLDYIGENTAGIKKLDYSDLTEDISEFAYLDYKRFVMYNMTDVIVQYCIEFKTDDIPYLYSKALMNSTQYKKVHRQTVYLAQRAIDRFKVYGNFIMGNNLNKFKPKPEGKYEGAFVADPILYSDKNKDRLNNGTVINRCSNVDDFDFKALYPSETREHGMAPNTLIGYIAMPNKIYYNENSIHNPKYTRSGQFIEDFISDNPILFGHRWFKLANTMQMFNDVIEYFTSKEVPFNPVYNYLSPKIIPIYVYDKDAKINPIFEVTKEQLELMNKSIPKLSDEQKNVLKITN